MRGPTLATLVLATLALATGCRPADPLVAARSVMPEDEAPIVLGPGDTLELETFGDPWSAMATVSEAGTIEVPLCGEIEVSDIGTAEACERVAACRARFVRAPSVRLRVLESTQADALAGCAAEGAAAPPGDDPVVTSVMALARRPAPVDVWLLERATRVAAQLAALRVALTNEHPRIIGARQRFERLVAAADAPGGAHEAAGAELRVRLLAEVTRERMVVERSGKGPKHPDTRRAQAKIDVLEAVAHRLPEATDFAFQHVAALETEATAQAWLRHGDGQDERSARALSMRSSVPATVDPLPCDAVHAQLRARLAYLSGARARAVDPTEAAVLDDVIDALTLARVRTCAPADAQAGQEAGDSAGASAGASGAAASSAGAASSTHSSPPT